MLPGTLSSRFQLGYFAQALKRQSSMATGSVLCARVVSENRAGIAQPDAVGGDDEELDLPHVDAALGEHHAGGFALRLVAPQPAALFQ